MATPQELAASVGALTENQVKELNTFLDVPIALKQISTDQNLQDLADEINEQSNADFDQFVAVLDTSGTVKGGRRPC